LYVDKLRNLDHFVNDLLLDPRTYRPRLDHPKLGIPLQCDPLPQDEFA
jgi:hypothetical protein